VKLGGWLIGAMLTRGERERTNYTSSIIGGREASPQPT